MFYLGYTSMIPFENGFLCNMIFDKLDLHARSQYPVDGRKMVVVMMCHHY